jgi:putative nucleotidyltransferase with HDIG domain
VGRFTGRPTESSASATGESGEEPPTRVLFVDPDAAQLRLFQRTLRDEDCVVRTAATGGEGLRLLDEAVHAVVVVDLVLPDMSGMEFLSRAARERPETVRILSLQRIDPDSVLEAVNKVGVFRILQKPWDGSQLRTSVRRAVVQHRALVDQQLMLVRLNDVNGRLQQLNRELDARVIERTEQLLLSLCNALDLRDTDTQWHSRRVALYSRRLAEELRLDGELVLDIERGALLHDIGKIGVSDSILLKPGKLTEEEWERMRLHADLGAQLLEGIRFLGQAQQIVRQHHERWDGFGYAGRLRGPDICIGARIFSVIDTYDAMTSDRPYRKAPGYDAALAEIRKGTATQFDPEVVRAFERIERREWEAIRECASRGESVPGRS